MQYQIKRSTAANRKSAGRSRRRREPPDEASRSTCQEASGHHASISPGAGDLRDQNDVAMRRTAGKKTYPDSSLGDGRTVGQRRLDLIAHW